MKKTIVALMVTMMLLSTTANAGILILTGDIGNKFQGYKTVGWITVLFTGVTLVGLVIDETDATNANVKIPELSEASLALIQTETAKAHSTAVETKSDFVTTISAASASKIIALEGLENTVEGDALFKTLTTK